MYDTTGGSGAVCREPHRSIPVTGLYFPEESPRKMSEISIFNRIEERLKRNKVKPGLLGVVGEQEPDPSDCCTSALGPLSRPELNFAYCG
jgi:hypothetical protein